MSRDEAARRSYGSASAMLKPTGLVPAWLSEYAVKPYRPTMSVCRLSVWRFAAMMGNVLYYNFHEAKE